MRKVVLTLKAIISNRQNNDLNIDLNIGKSTDNINKDNNSEIDINKDLSIDSNIIVLNNIEKINSSSQDQVFMTDPNNISPTQIANLSRDSFDSIFDNFHEKIVDKLVAFMIKKHNEGITFDHIKHLIEQQILRLDIPSNNILNWLLKNQDKPKCIYFLGVFYSYSICNIDENSSKAF